MSEFLIDELGNKIWYDIDTHYPDDDNEDFYIYVNYSNQEEFWIRPHREDGPAVIWIDGSEDFYVRGKKHREDGPVGIYYSNLVEWWLNGEPYPFSDWCEKLNKSEEEINFLKLKWDVL